MKRSNPPPPLQMQIAWPEPNIYLCVYCFDSVRYRPIGVLGRQRHHRHVPRSHKWAALTRWSGGDQSRPDTWDTHIHQTYGFVFFHDEPYRDKEPSHYSQSLVDNRMVDSTSGLYTAEYHLRTLSSMSDKVCLSDCAHDACHIASCAETRGVG